MDQLPPTSDTAELKAARSLEYFITGQYEAALNGLDCNFDDPELKEISMRRKAESLYQCHLYQECIDTYNGILEEFECDKIDHDHLKEATARLAEQEQGAFDFGLMQKMSMHDMSLILNHATYEGPVVIKESPVHGRGVFTTKAVKAGELLLCEKALSYKFKIDEKTSTKSNMPVHKYSRMYVVDNVLVNTQTDTVYQGPLLDLIGDTIVRATKSQAMRSKLFDLNSGDFPKEDNNNAVDRYVLVNAAISNPQTNKS